MTNMDSNLGKYYIAEYVNKDAQSSLGLTLFNVPEGDRYSLIFITTNDGQVFARSKLFSIKNPPAAGVVPTASTTSTQPLATLSIIVTGPPNQSTGAEQSWLYKYPVSCTSSRF